MRKPTTKIKTIEGELYTVLLTPLELELLDLFKELFHANGRGAVINKMIMLEFCNGEPFKKDEILNAKRFKLFIAISLLEDRVKKEPKRSIRVRLTEEARNVVKERSEQASTSQSQLIGVTIHKMALRYFGLSCKTSNKNLTGMCVFDLFIIFSFYYFF